jgi:hypothetical protein
MPPDAVPKTIADVNEGSQSGFKAVATTLFPDLKDIDTLPLSDLWEGALRRFPSIPIANALFKAEMNRKLAEVKLTQTAPESWQPLVTLANSGVQLYSLPADDKQLLFVLRTLGSLDPTAKPPRSPTRETAGRKPTVNKHCFWEQRSPVYRPIPRTRIYIRDPQ